MNTLRWLLATLVLLAPNLATGQEARLSATEVFGRGAFQARLDLVRWSNDLSTHTALSRGSTGRNDTIGGRVDHLVERYRVARKVPGIAIAVVRNGTVIKATGYGTASLELGTPVTPNTLFGIGSISKMFTATAVMQLQEQGKLRIDDSITRYVDSLPSHWAPVTIRHLLAHTSGLPEEHWPPNSIEFGRTEHRQLNVLRSIFADSLEFPPGGGWAYRNSGYRLLGMVIEQASGESYWSWLDRRIFRPLGMAATRSSDPNSIIPNRAKGYGRHPTAYGTERGRIVNRDAVTASGAFSEGALMSSVLDLARWDSTLYRPTILSQASLDQMWTPVTLTDGTVRTFGFGWIVAPTNGLRTVWHAGGLAGFRTNISRFVAKGLTVIVLTNCEWANPVGLTAAIAGLYESELLPPPAPVISDPDSGFVTLARGLVEDIGRGHLERRRFTSAASEQWPDEALQEAAQLVRRFGAVRRLELLARNQFRDVVSRRYRVRLERGKLFLTVVTDRAGLISDLSVEEAVLDRE